MYTLRVLHPSGDEQNYYLGDLYKVTLKDKSPDNFKLTYDSYLEKNIDLEDLNLIDFMGVENANIKEIAKTYPNSKVIARGNEIIVKGAETDVLQIEKIIDLIKNQLLKTGKISKDQLSGFISQEKNEIESLLDDDLILIGTKGNVIKATVRQTMDQPSMIFNGEYYKSKISYYEVDCANNRCKAKAILYSESGKIVHEQTYDWGAPDSTPDTKTIQYLCK